MTSLDLAQPAAKRRRRGPGSGEAIRLLVAMAIVASLAGIAAFRQFGDGLVAVAIAGVAVILLVSVLDAFGLLGHR